QPDAGDPSAARASLTVASYGFAGPVNDIAAAPDGSILVAEGSTVREIRRGRIGTVSEVPTQPGSPVNGLVAVGRGNYFATSGGLDLAEGAGLWRVSRGSARLVADIEAFETQHDPDALEGPRWKDQRCEEDPIQGFSA